MYDGSCAPREHRAKELTQRANDAFAKVAILARRARSRRESKPHIYIYIYIYIYRVRPPRQTILNSCSLSVKSAVSVHPKSDFFLCSQENSGKYKKNKQPNNQTTKKHKHAKHKNKKHTAKNPKSFEQFMHNFSLFLW